MDKLISIIISNRNDTTMLSVTIRSCIEALRPLGLHKCEIIIADNSDPIPHSYLPSIIPNKYIKQGLIKFFFQPFPCLFSARELAIKYSSSPYILCLDSHMLIGYNMIVDLISFMESHKTDKEVGFAHAPINWAHQHESAAKHDRDMSVNELGNWNTKYSSIRTITWKGMPWICRKSFWNSIKGYGSLAKHHISWGGGDMHIGIKPWLLGYKNYAVPTNPGIHIGPFPKLDTKNNPNSSIIGPDKYRLYSTSGKTSQCLGFLTSCYVLGGEPMMLRNKDAIKERFGRYLDLDKEWPTAISLGQEERDWLLSNQKISFEQLLKTKPWDQESISK